MKLSEDLLKKLAKHYEPSSMVDLTFKGNDVSFKTDEVGNPVLLFIGKRTDDGNIRGERYARRLKFADDGTLVKDHWELKGKAT
ncbi:hypothetical protein MKQ68_11340 [Chitinophaga horti]|uniref:Uncharacterized protein n=1 Tax=Chitinophaga horti TaxID=2920382 RepID=A0ABY6J886_9BACT|nr:hypothetical protein [Chitinophaga horti]UYQ95695.1 hypothetical protein MKQ68_11340 [Chitinophaga horti]